MNFQNEKRKACRSKRLCWIPRERHGTKREGCLLRPETTSCLQGNHFGGLRRISTEPSASRTPQQNGLAERSGGVAMTQARTIRIESNLSQNPWLKSTQRCISTIEHQENQARVDKAQKQHMTHTPKSPLLWMPFENLNLHTACRICAITETTSWKGIAQYFQDLNTPRLSRQEICFSTKKSSRRTNIH